MKTVKMEDIAKAAGVSKSTVSQFLNKRFEFMSQETREKIERVIKETGYQPNVLARSLKVKKTNTIGVIVSNIMYYFSTAVSRGIEDYCNQHNYNVILCNTDNNPEKEKKYWEMLLTKQVDGIITASSNIENNEFLHDMIEKNFPVVLIDRKLPDVKVSGVFSDNVGGARAAVDHLVELGHRKIAYLSPTIQGISPRQERYEGYVQALKAHQIEVQTDYIQFIDQVSYTKESLMTFLRLPKPPTAILCTNDLVTMEALKILKEEGIRIPQDLALIGFDDSPWTILMDPPLTVVAQRTYEIGYKSAEFLLDQIKNPKSKRFQSHIFDCKLQVRKSCGFQ